MSFTNEMFLLIRHLDEVKGFYYCLFKLGILTERETQVLYHNSHSLLLERARRLE